MVAVTDKVVKSETDSTTLDCSVTALSAGVSISWYLENVDTALEHNVDGECSARKSQEGYCLQVNNFTR